MRRAISLDQYNKALVKIENKMIMIEPNVDLFDMKRPKKDVFLSLSG